MKDLTLFDIPEREIPMMPADLFGKEQPSCGYTNTNPREWTPEEIKWLLSMRSQGYTIAEIGESMKRSETSISIKMKRLKKKDEGYNEEHRREKYQANQEFLEHFKDTRDGIIPTVLDLYCGTESWWKKHGCMTLANDADKTVEADYHEKAEKLIHSLYYHNKSFDIVDLDPFGSAYDCFDLAIKMAYSGLVITFGELGHKRWKRLDFVSRYYDIDKLEDFSTETLIRKVDDIARRNKKHLVPFKVCEWKHISRVYFDIEPIKITEQWNK